MVDLTARDWADERLDKERDLPDDFEGDLGYDVAANEEAT